MHGWLNLSQWYNMDITSILASSLIQMLLGSTRSMFIVYL